LYQLNPKQREAVSHIHGPLLVLAGAGSGKTSVITKKIQHLIENCQYQPQHIAAITFTNKAAKEMAERVSRLMKGTSIKGLKIATFHNLGLQFIRQELQHFPLRKNFSIFDGHDSLALLKEIAPIEIAADKQTLYEIQQQISNWKNELKSPLQLKTAAKDQDQRISALVYEKYQRYLQAYNAVDFDDLIRLPVELLKTNPEVREHWQHKIRYLLVDEYQDTNTCQYLMVTLLAGTRAHFTVVGDDDQSIYAWRGANPQNLALLQKDFPQLEVVKLEQNYRSTGRILKAANQLIKNNSHIFVKNLWSDHNFGDPIQILELANEEEESERIAAEMITLHFNKGIPYHDFAVLYRGNHQSRSVEKAMLANNIPFRVSGGTSFFSRAEIKDMMAYFRLISNSDDDNAFLRIVNVPRREIGATTLEKLGTIASQQQCSLFEAINEQWLPVEMAKRGVKVLLQFKNLIETVSKQLQQQNIESVLLNFINKMGYEYWLLENSSSDKLADFKWSNVKDLIQWVSKMAVDDQGQEVELAAIVNKLMLRELIDQQQQEEQDCVELMTLHAAKGLEFNRVYLIGMEEEIIPHRSSMDEGNLEEERRLAYVGITRAKKNLSMTMAKVRRRFGEQIRCEPSRFLDELPQEDLVWQNRRQDLSEEERKQNNQAHIENLRAMFQK